MQADKGTISIILIYRGESHHILTYANEYYSLMTLISDHLAIPGFGLCCGMGSCGTCRVELGNQYSALSRQVLACGVRIDDELSNTQITIPEPRY
jgi:aerobic-type carbon monoxide dehydrogenase small subunit (CoxS/CutS family)